MSVCVHVIKDRYRYILDIDIYDIDIQACREWIMNTVIMQTSK